MNKFKIDGLEEYKPESPKNLALIDGQTVPYSLCHKHNYDDSAEHYNEHFIFLGKGTISHYWTEALGQHISASSKDEYYFWV